MLLFLVNIFGMITLGFSNLCSMEFCLLLLQIVLSRIDGLS